MKSLFQRSRKIRGAALLLALWALFVLSAVVISWAVDIGSQLTLSGNANRMLDAEALACSGVEVALHPGIKPGAASLQGMLGRGKSYEARISGEGGRLNLNWLIAGEDPGRLGVLRKYLELKGIDLNEQDHMIDCLLDWVEPNTGTHHLNGASDADDYYPSHTLLTRIDELKKVKGWEQFTSQPGWDEELTLNTNPPTVDIAWASRDVLLSLPGLTNAMVDRFLQYRRGPDGLDGTADDVQFTGLPDALAALGIQQEQSEELSALITINSPQFRVVSVGKAGDVTHVVQMVFRRTGIVPQVITWKEF